MKIFEAEINYRHKINFVDDNNVFVGFDYRSSCCEDFGYHLSKKKLGPGATHPLPHGEDATDFPGFNFDTSFMEEDLFPAKANGGSITFRLVNGSGEEMFLTLYNHHNGYYSHGLEFRTGGAKGDLIKAAFI